MTPVSIANQILSILTVAGQVIIIVLSVAFLVDKKILSWVLRNAILFSFIVAFIAMSGSLFYSEIAGYEPCKLCWFQRILMYPQVILFGIALLLKDRHVAPYSITLSIIGASIALYHYLLQIGVTSGFPCAAVGYSVSCTKRFVMLFGYITIPMMALTAFVLIALFMILSKKIAGKTKL